MRLIVKRTKKEPRRGEWAGSGNSTREVCAAERAASVHGEAVEEHLNPVCWRDGDDAYSHLCLVVSDLIAEGQGSSLKVACSTIIFRVVPFEGRPYLWC
jgi:hypothetical protein